MGLPIYFDYRFNAASEYMAKMNNIGKYCKANTIIPKNDLFEPFRLLKNYIPESVREHFNEAEYSASKSPSFSKKIDYDSETKTFSFKEYTYKAEDKRAVAYIIGTEFAKLVPGKINVDFGTPTFGFRKEETETSFSLTGEYVNLSSFFGLLFEYLYLVEKEGKEEISLGALFVSPKAQKIACEKFVNKYLDMFSKRFRKYKAEKDKYIKLLPGKNDELNVNEYQDASSELQREEDFEADSSIRIEAATFSKVLDLINLGLTYEQYQNFFAECVKSQNIAETQEETSYVSLQKAFEDNNGKNNETDKVKKRLLIFGCKNPKKAV